MALPCPLHSRLVRSALTSGLASTSRRYSTGLQQMPMLLNGRTSLSLQHMNGLFGLRGLTRPLHTTLHLKATHSETSRVSRRGGRPPWMFTGPKYNWVFWGIAGLNVAVFGKWWLAQGQYEMNRDPEPLRNMFRYWTTSWRNVVVEGRPYVLTHVASVVSLNVNIGGQC
jgi:hypothetical protein